MIDKYVYVIVALLPLSALMLVFQTNPYHALVIRAILGAVAALIYAVLGAADVALTEALVGTMLAITLYVVAVRSSLVMRLGVLQEESGRQGNLVNKSFLVNKKNCFIKSIASVKKAINKYHLRLELIEYPNLSALEQALIAGEVHGICTKRSSEANNALLLNTKVRVRRLFEILQSELTTPETQLTLVSVPDGEDKH